MSIAIGLWSVQLTPGKEEVVVPQADLRITNAALSDQVTDANSRTTVKFSYVTPIRMDSDDEDDDDMEVPPTNTTVLCSLTPGKIEHATTDIILEQDEEYTFTVVGKNPIYLTGNYIDQTSADHPPFDDEDDSDMDSEDAYDLREVSSDVEMHPDEFDDVDSDASRFEEVDDEESPKAQKRPRESDVDAEKQTKAEKKQNKKQKAESGKAVPAGADSTDKKEEKKEEKKEGKKDKKKDEKKTEPKEHEVAGGVKVKDAKIGAGPMAKKGNTVSVRYIGKLPNGKVFDQNTKGKPFTFHLGKGEVIKGWDVGIAGMQPGGERKLTIPANMAYGKRGTEGIPPNATLIFEVKLIEIK